MASLVHGRLQSIGTVCSKGVPLRAGSVKMTPALAQPCYSMPRRRLLEPGTFSSNARSYRHVRSAADYPSELPKVSAVQGGWFAPNSSLLARSSTLRHFPVHHARYLTPASQGNVQRSCGEVDDSLHYRRRVRARPAIQDNDGSPRDSLLQTWCVSCVAVDGNTGYIGRFFQRNNRNILREVGTII